MATMTQRPMVPARNLWDGPLPVETFLEGASETFVTGEVVESETDGYVGQVSAAADPYVPTQIVGIARGDGGNTTGEGTNEIEVACALPGQVFEANMMEGHATDAATHTSAQTDLMSPMALTQDTTESKTFLDASIVTGTSIRTYTLRLGRGYLVSSSSTRVEQVITDNDVRVEFVFLPDETIWGLTTA